MNTMQLPDFNGYYVFVVEGNGVFDLSEFLEKVNLKVKFKASVRSHVFGEGDKYLAMVLVPQKHVENK